MGEERKRGGEERGNVVTVVEGIYAACVRKRCDFE